MLFFLVKMANNSWERSLSCSLLCLLLGFASPLTFNAQQVGLLKSYVPTEYRPPFWAKNCHLATILGSLSIQEKWFGFPQTIPDFQRNEFQSSDGDYVAVDFLRGLGEEKKSSSSNITVVIVHGMESGTRKPFCAKIALTLQRAGFNVASIMFRGCGETMPQKIKTYHAGFTEDLDLVVRRLGADGDQKLILCGFSLGGNVILKYLGEIGELAIELGIIGSAVACVPFEWTSTIEKLDGSFFNRNAYSRNFLETLIPKALHQAERFPKARLDVERLKNARTIGEYDDAFVAPVFGFSGRADYYQKISCFQYLHSVRVPSYCINALDDPFIEKSMLPSYDSDRVKANSSKSIGAARQSFITALLHALVSIWQKIQHVVMSAVEQKRKINEPLQSCCASPFFRLHCKQYGGHIGFVQADYWAKADSCWLANELVNFAKHLRANGISGGGVPL